jgi:PAS domain S-box-containing protein
MQNITSLPHGLSREALIRLESLAKEHGITPSDALMQLLDQDAGVRQRVEQPASESTELLSGILSSTMDAIITTNEDRHIILFNKAAERIFRCSASAAIGQSLDQFLPGRLQSAYVGNANQLGTSSIVQRPTSAPGPIYGRRADGEEFPIETVISQQMVGSQHLFTAIVRDVTERYRTERALRESESYFQAIAASIPAALTITSVADGTLLYANSRAVTYVGGEREYLANLIGQMRYDDDGTQPTLLTEALRRGVVASRTLKLHRPDQAVIWLLVSMRQIVYQGQDAVLAISQDITEQTRHEEKLAELAAIVEHSYEAIVSKTLDGLVLSWNKGAERLYGYTAEEMIGQPVLRVFPPELVGEEAEMLALIQQGEVIVNFESVRVHKNGDRLDVSLTYSPLRDMNGVVVGVAVIAHDITQQKRQASLEEALARERTLNTLRARFTSMVSHEFRTPLASILSSVELQQYYADRLTPERRTQQLAAIAEDVKRLTSMLDEMLLISKSENFGLEFRPRPLQLDSFCQTIAGEHARLSQRQISFMFYGGAEQRMLDPDLLRLIIGNLVSNALKYSSEDTPVLLEARYEGESVEIRVEDHGIGIPAADQPYVFEAFHRGENINRTPGTGLGLAIVSRAVDAHHGHVRLESQVGVGTRFTVVLPAPPAYPAS